MHHYLINNLKCAEGCECMCGDVVSVSNARISEEVRQNVVVIHIPAVLLRGLVDDKVFLQRKVQLHYRCQVPQPIAVVGGRPHRRQFIVKVPLVPLLHQLVRPHYHFHLVYLLKLLHCPSTEQPPRTSRVLTPGIDVLLGVRPHEIAERPRGRDFYVSFQSPDGVDGGAFGGKSPVYTEYLSFDDGCERQVVEGVVEVVPNVVVAVLARDFVIESVDVCDVSGLVVSPQQHHHLGVLQLVEEQQQDRLHRIVPAVHVVPQEHVSLLGDRPSAAEQFEQIPKLSVDIAADGDWRLDGLYVGLLEEQGLDSAAEHLHCLLGDHLALEYRFDQRIHVHQYTILANQNLPPPASPQCRLAKNK